MRSNMEVQETKLENMRVEYGGEALTPDQLEADPFDQFAGWLEAAQRAGVREPNAMSLSTVSAEGRPSIRTVLLKHFDIQGFVFFTNFESRKSREIAANPNVALLFPWLDLNRQVSVRGVAERIGSVESLKYFLKRPLASQLGTWASPQSQVISSRSVLETKFEEMKRKFADGKVPLPSFWGGFRVVPSQIEFWQGGGHRLHDRLLYTRMKNSGWKIERLAP